MNHKISNFSPSTVELVCLSLICEIPTFDIVWPSEHWLSVHSKSRVYKQNVPPSHLSHKVEEKNMDTVVSNSALLSIPQLPPVRSLTSNSYSSTTSLYLSSSKLFPSFFFRRQKKQVGHRSSSCTPPRFSIASSAAIQEINETQFRDSVLNSDRPVLVEFVANWCGPCRLISPAMEWVAQVQFCVSSIFL